jgi:hypothetical protein
LSLTNTLKFGLGRAGRTTRLLFVMGVKHLFSLFSDQCCSLTGEKYAVENTLDFPITENSLQLPLDLTIADGVLCVRVHRSWGEAVKSFQEKSVHQ